MKIWQWFLAHGDKLLGGVAIALLALQTGGYIPASIAPLVTALLGVLHTLVLPEPTAAPIGPNTGSATKQGGFARMQVVLILLAISALGSLHLVACKTLPSAGAQAGISAAIDIATGIAVQQGTNDPAVWKARATQFETAAKAIATVNAAGPTSLQTLMADLQPYIAKLGPADVLAANALVAALQPIIAQQLGTNPTLANTQREIALILQDVIAACSAYTGS